MYRIAIHGGAGTISTALMTPEKEKNYKQALNEALQCGNVILAKGGTAIDAVTAAVTALENCPLFNAGIGAVYNHNGNHELDASIMNGKTLRGGAVAALEHILNPIQLAKLVAEKSEHVMLIGAGAEKFAQENGVALVENKLFDTEFRYLQWQEIKDTNTFSLDHAVEIKNPKMGTVGAVALDIYGNLAAATSTGGMTNKKWGRVGDTPIIGAGTYANNNTCAISCTGHGEYFIEQVVAYDIHCLMLYKGLTLQAACDFVVNDKLKKIGAEGGLIAIDNKGNICLPFNSEGMYRAWAIENTLETAIY